MDSIAFFYLVLKMDFGEHFEISFQVALAPLYLLLSSDPSTIRLSSRMVRISAVSPPFNISSPLSLNVIKLRVLLIHTSFTCDNLASISFSLSAEMQMSYGCKKPSLVGWRAE